jgi:mono/diheme cytochrome c family protein
MNQRIAGRRAAGLLACTLLGLIVVTGCSKTASGPAADSPQPAPALVAETPAPAAVTPTPTGPFAAGKTVFATSCARCHSVGPTGGQAASSGPAPGWGRGRGPDLAKVGAQHTPDWIAEHIRNPQAHKENSRMPKFAGKLKDQDMTALVEYLGSLKGS